MIPFSVSINVYPSVCLSVCLSAGKELEDLSFDSTCGSDDYRAVVGVNVLLCMLGLHALGVTHNDYHYGNLLVADEATGELKVIDLESLRKVAGSDTPYPPAERTARPAPSRPTPPASLPCRATRPRRTCHCTT